MFPEIEQKNLLTKILTTFPILCQIISCTKNVFF